MAGEREAEKGVLILHSVAKERRVMVFDPRMNSFTIDMMNKVWTFGRYLGKWNGMFFHNLLQLCQKKIRLRTFVKKLVYQQQI